VLNLLWALFVIAVEATNMDKTLMSQLVRAFEFWFLQANVALFWAAFLVETILLAKQDGYLPCSGTGSLGTSAYQLNVMVSRVS